MKRVVAMASHQPASTDSQTNEPRILRWDLGTNRLADSLDHSEGGHRSRSSDQYGRIVPSVRRASRNRHDNLGEPPSAVSDRTGALNRRLGNLWCKNT